MTEVTPDVLETATRLVGQAGLPLPLTVTRLRGGRNNRVYQIDDAAVLKLYHWDPRDTRDRLRAEWQFLAYVWSRGVRGVPRPLASDAAAHAGLYAKLPGRPLEPGEIGAGQVDAALDFLLAVNAPPRMPLTLDPGSEACFTLAEHLATIDRRVDRLGTIDPGAPRAGAAEALVRGRLVPLWQGVRRGILEGAARLRLAADETLPDAALCISPSDFGFHNALADGGRVGFLDFEYAGRDDPAKLVCDFFCQPSVPAPIALMETFTQRLIAGLGLGSVHAARCHLLLDAYRIKWACIILNDFLPLGSARRAFADLARTEERAAAQLSRAAAKLNEIDSAERTHHHGLS